MADNDINGLYCIWKHFAEYKLERKTNPQTGRINQGDEKNREDDNINVIGNCNMDSINIVG